MTPPIWESVQLQSYNPTLTNTYVAVTATKQAPIPGFDLGFIADRGVKDTTQVLDG
jgi:hypothetical protein